MKLRGRGQVEVNYGWVKMRCAEEEETSSHKGLERRVKGRRDEEDRMSMRVSEERRGMETSMRKSP